VALRFRSLLVVTAMAPLALVTACTGGQPVAGQTAAPGAGAGLGSPLNPGGGPVPSSPGSARLTLKESGSTLLFSLFGTWATAYHQQYPNITIKLAPGPLGKGTGSGQGIEDVSTKKANIGASDAFLSSGNLVQHSDLLNIPLAISAQQVNYYLPSLRLPPGKRLQLDGPVLAEMYQGKIKKWNDQAIQALNKGISLPSTPVHPLHRGETTGSGDTFLFTSYLSATDLAWNSQVGFGAAVSWPNIASAQAETGNSGMVTACSVTPGCVAYVGISYLKTAQDAGLGEASLQNFSGNYYQPTPSAISAAVSSFVSDTPADETISMINGPAPNGYPIVNYEYAIVLADQPNPAVARAIKAFLNWVITKGKGNSPSFLNSVQFQPLPPAIVKLADAQISEIK
jgi:phosphate transport system substrate-binding protein